MPITVPVITVGASNYGTPPATGTGDAAPPVAIGMIINKSELDNIAASGAYWTGSSGEVWDVAVDFYRNFTISTATISLDSDSDTLVGNMRKVMAAAIVFARLKPANGIGNPVVDEAAPSFTCDELRAKIADAIETVIGQANSAGTADTRPQRQLGGWAIIADLINLPAYDSALNSTAAQGGGTNTGFLGWLDYCMAFEFSGFSVAECRGKRLNNKGAHSRFSTIACEAYKRGSLGTSTMLGRMADVMRRWLGDTSIENVTGESSSGSPASLFQGVSNEMAEGATWQASPVLVDNLDRVGVNALGATKDGNNLDGLLPGDQYRGYYNVGDGTGGADSDPSSYRADFFPNRWDGVEYVENTLYGTAAACLILYRCGYTDILTAQDSALHRAAAWVKWAHDNHSSRGYEYFGISTGATAESFKPLLKYLYPSSTLPTTKVRTSLSGSGFGWGWGYWLFSGRSI